MFGEIYDPICENTATFSSHREDCNRNRFGSSRMERWRRSGRAFRHQSLASTSGMDTRETAFDAILQKSDHGATNF
jgi:hypothetical protein